MRRYDDPVDVRKGRVQGSTGSVEGPEQFLWHGRLWQVRDVVAHWVETGPWWQSAGVRAVIGSEDQPEAAGTVATLTSPRPARRARGLAGGGDAAGTRRSPSPTTPRSPARLRGLRPDLLLVDRWLAADRLRGLGAW